MCRGCQRPLPRPAAEPGRLPGEAPRAARVGDLRAEGPQEDEAVVFEQEEKAGVEEARLPQKKLTRQSPRLLNPDLFRHGPSRGVLPLSRMTDDLVGRGRILSQNSLNGHVLGRKQEG